MSDNSKLIDKIRKLRNMAADKSVSEAEATAFAEKVRALLSEHGLSMTDLGSDKTEEESVGHERKRGKWEASPARQVLLRAVCRFYLCEAVGPGKNNDKVWTIVGRPTNVMVATDMFDYLLGTVIRMSNQYAKDNPGSNKIDWRRGCMGRLAERLREMFEAERAKPQTRHSGGGASNLPALITDEQLLIKGHLKSMGVVYGKSSPLKQGDDAARGRAAAESIGLHRQIGNGGGRLAIGSK